MLAACSFSLNAQQKKYVMVIHGGAGTILKKNMTPEKEAAYTAALTAALKAGYAAIQSGKSSLDAVEASIHVMEDSPLFNAGKGAVFTHDGRNELDASIMNGKTLEAGAVAGVTTVKNPISAARAVMEKSEHVMMVGAGADKFAKEAGLEIVDPKYFWTKERWDGLQKAIQEDSTKAVLDHGSKKSMKMGIQNHDNKFGTVGCVALDKSGNLAAGTSTGGMTNKKYGLAEAAKVVLDKVGKMGGDGGLIALDKKGNVTMPFNTEGMYRGTVTADGLMQCASAQNSAKGSLFIIGGGNRSDALIKQLVSTAGLGSKDYIIVLPMASEQPDTGFKYISQQLKKETNATIRNFDFNHHSTQDKKWTDSVAGAKLIYILGGDQNHFMKAVLGTPVYTAIHEAYQKGATIAGTSAGAAVMSRYMITGKQLQEQKYKETFDRLWYHNIEFAEGLGLLKQTIIDQHFLKRSRYNRLISALADKPDYICVGIDEGTAIIVKGDRATVAGESQVIRFALPQKAVKASDQLISFKTLEMGIFTAGDVIGIKP
eukprot:gene21937-26039_t